MRVLDSEDLRWVSGGCIDTYTGVDDYCDQYDFLPEGYYLDEYGNLVESGAYESLGEWYVDDVVVRGTQDNDQGWYLNFGLGLGGGFNLSFSERGVDFSVGAGIWGTFEFGNAVTPAEFDENTQHNRLFAFGKIDGVGVGVEYDYAGDRWTNVFGPAEIEVTSDDIDVSVVGVDVEDPRNFTLGISGGFGWQMFYGSRDWNPPN